MPPRRAHASYQPTRSGYFQLAGYCHDHRKKPMEKLSQTRRAEAIFVAWGGWSGCDQCMGTESVWDLRAVSQREFYLGAIALACDDASCLLNIQLLDCCLTAGILRPKLPNRADDDSSMCQSGYKEARLAQAIQSVLSEEAKEAKPDPSSRSETVDIDRHYITQSHGNPFWRYNPKQYYQYTLSEAARVTQHHRSLQTLLSLHRAFDNPDRATRETNGSVHAVAVPCSRQKVHETSVWWTAFNTSTRTLAHSHTLLSTQAHSHSNIHTLTHSHSHIRTLTPSNPLICI
jgi:hypothetical protein